MTRKFFPLVIVLLLAACATQKEYEAMLDTWIGKTERQLVEAWGIPDKQYRPDRQTRMVSYVRSRTATYSTGVTGCYGAIPGRNFATGACIGAPPPETRNFHCETTFRITRGRITRWGVAGNDCVAR